MTDTPKDPQATLSPIAVGPDEAARLAGVGRTTLYAALAKGDLPSIKIGTRRLVRVDAIREWLEAHEQKPGA